MMMFSLFFVVLSLTNALDCNICGTGNVIGNEKGVVTIRYEGQEYTQNCETWQQSLLLTNAWCEQYMVDYTEEICACRRADEKPTTAPPEEDESVVDVVQEDVDEVVDETKDNVDEAVDEVTEDLKEEWHQQKKTIATIGIIVGLALVLSCVLCVLCCCWCMGK